MKEAWRRVEEQQESGQVPQGVPQSEVAMKMSRGIAGQWLGPQLAGQEETELRPQLGMYSPHTHPAPLPKGTVVLEPACCPPSPPLCCPPQQKAGVPERGPRYICEH